MFGLAGRLELGQRQNLDVGLAVVLRPQDEVAVLDLAHLQGSVVSGPRADLQYVMSRTKIEILKHVGHRRWPRRGAERHTVQAPRYESLILTHAGDRKLWQEQVPRHLDPQAALCA